MTTPTSLRQTRVLLIDDNEIIIGSLRRCLLTQGCVVDVVLGPASAAKLMASRIDSQHSVPNRSKRSL
jgi:hypothetical protein